MPTDRKQKRGTTNYLLRDIPKSTLKQAHAVLKADGDRTLKAELLRAIEAIAARSTKA